MIFLLMGLGGSEMSSVMIVVSAALLALLITWENWFSAGEELWTQIEDVDDWAGREADYMIEQQEFAEEYANDHYDPEDDCDDDDGPRSDGQGDKWEANEEWFARFGIEPWEV